MAVRLALQPPQDKKEAFEQLPTPFKAGQMKNCGNGIDLVGGG